MEESQALAPNVNVTSHEFNAATNTLEFSAKDLRFALVALIMGFLFINFVLLENLSLSAAVFGLTLIVFTLVFMKMYEIKQSAASFSYLLISIVSAAYFFISANELVKFLNFTFFGLVFAYWITLSFKQNLEKGFSAYTPVELLKTVAVTPLLSLGVLPKAVLSLGKKGGKGKNIILILAGVVIAAPFTMIVISLLASADYAFQKMFQFIYDNLFENGIKYIFQFAFGIPVAIYLFGLLYAYAKNRVPSKITKENADKFSENLRRAPLLLVCSALTPLCLIYIIYFIAQANYFLSGLKWVLPAGFSFAEYARRGFFELSAVSFINLFVICLSLLLAQKTQNGKTLKIYITALCCFTVLLIVTAISKMLMYISSYGLTPLRVYTTWFMLLLFLIFLFIIFKQLLPKFKAARWVGRAFIAMFLILMFSNTDALIAKYNIDRYLSGTLNEVDFEMLGNLSDSAAPYVQKLCDNQSSEVRENAKKWINSRKERISARNSWKELNLPRIYLTYIDKV
jgi:hypothetical protein